jgi:anti-sigma regulatory factor (Ser/Thr protein kinase)
MLRRTVELGADLSDVARMNDWLQGLARDAGLPDALRDDIKLCLNEAVANIIMYGTAPDGALRIRLAVEASATGARAVLADTAHAFDPLAHPEPAKITSVETAQVGGFGISLIRATASAVSYARENGQNVLTVVCGAP